MYTVKIKGVDKTALLLRKSLTIKKKADNRSNCSMSLLTDASYVDVIGHDLQVLDGATVVFGGIIKTAKLDKMEPGVGATVLLKLTIISNGYGDIPQRRTISNAWTSGTTCGDVVMFIVTDVFGDVSNDEHITAGTIDDGAMLTEYKPICKSCKDILDDMADASGFKWYIDDAKKLNFLAEDTVVDATYDIVEGGTFTDYDIKSVQSDLKDYRNKQFVVGADELLYIETDATEITARQTAEGAGYSSGVYGDVIRDTAVESEEDAAVVAASALRKYGFVPTEVEITTFTNAWIAGTKTTVALATFGIASSSFLVEEVTIRDLDGVNLQSTVRLSKRKAADFSNQRGDGFLEYFGKLARSAGRVMASPGSGNVESGGADNLIVQDTAPEGAVENEVWVDSDYTADAGKAYFLDKTSDYPAWTGYPDSPYLLATYPYQVVANVMGAIQLFADVAPFYYEITDESSAEFAAAGAGKFRTYSGGAWINEYSYPTSVTVVSGNLTTVYNIVMACQTNHDINNRDTAALVKAKTTTAEQDTGLAWKPIVCDAADIPYDNTASGLTAEDVQAAIDELAGDAAPVASVNGETGEVVLDAGDIDIVDTGGNFTATDVEGALAELFTAITPYTLPQAVEDTLGGVKAKAKTTENSEIAIDSATGKLYAPAAGAAANGLPEGGTAGQILTKIDGTDYNAEWDDAPSGAITASAGWGQIGATLDGNVTFVVYASLSAVKIGATWIIEGEGNIATRTYNTNTFTTGISLTRIKTILGITDTLTWKGSNYSSLEIYAGNGYRYSYSYNQSTYGYGMALVNDNDNDSILTFARYYNTAGDVGGWGISTNCYAVNNTIKFRMVVDAS